MIFFSIFYSFLRNKTVVKFDSVKSGESVMFHCMCDFIFNKEPAPTVKFCTFHRLIRRVSVGLESNKATCATGTVKLAGNAGRSENTRFNIHCLTIKIAFALTQILHVTKIEGKELTLKECKIKIKETCSKDLNHLGKINCSYDEKWFRPALIINLVNKL